MSSFHSSHHLSSASTSFHLPCHHPAPAIISPPDHSTSALTSFSYACITSVHSRQYSKRGVSFQDVNINLKSSNGSHRTQNNAQPPMIAQHDSIASNLIAYTPLAHCAPALLAFHCLQHTWFFPPSGYLHTRTASWNVFPKISSVGHSLLWF